jgi:endonuclease YncB( thermonuclease family)
MLIFLRIFPVRWRSCHMNSDTGRHGTPGHCGYRNGAAAVLLVALFAAGATIVTASTVGRSAGPAAAAAASATVPTAAIEEWLNQKVRLRDTVQALDRPATDGKPMGEIRAGAEVQAIGLVAGKHWVRIELPDHSLVYVPRDAIEFESNNAATNPEKSTAGPSTAAPSAGPPAAPASRPGTIRGPVTKVPNAATLVVADQRIRLSGIDPGPEQDLHGFENWVRGQGALVCEPDAQTGRYRCFTGAGVDVAEAAILNGAGRVGDGALPAYRESETAARQGKRGLWGQP